MSGGCDDGSTTCEKKASLIWGLFCGAMLRLGPEWLSILSLEGLGLSVRDPSHVALSRSDEITQFIVVESRT